MTTRAIVFQQRLRITPANLLYVYYDSFDVLMAKLIFTKTFELLDWISSFISKTVFIRANDKEISFYLRESFSKCNWKMHVAKRMQRHFKLLMTIQNEALNVFEVPHLENRFLAISRESNKFTGLCTTIVFLTVPDSLEIDIHVHIDFTASALYVLSMRSMSQYRFALSRFDRFSDQIKLLS